jgi:glyoxylase-like metal-dependent hydrolase (beta-lactamase superfamily II)
MSPRRLGDIALARIIEQEGPILDTKVVFPKYTPELMAAQADWLVPRHTDPSGLKLNIAVQSFLIKTRRHTILVDSCVGNHKTRGRPEFNNKQFPFLARLQAAGTAPEGIDFVMCTHLHVDHVGWNTRLKDGRWVPTFPNAKYVFAKREYDHWEKEARTTGLPRTGNYMADSVLPVVEAGRAVFVEMDHELDTGVALYPLPGHTPGQCGVHVKSNGTEAIITGDMMHHPIQVAYPDWSTNFDTDPDAAHRTRRAFLEKYADSGTLVVPSHFVSPTAGYVESAKDTFRFRYAEED